MFTLLHSLNVLSGCTSICAHTCLKVSVFLEAIKHSMKQEISCVKICRGGELTREPARPVFSAKFHRSAPVGDAGGAARLTQKAHTANTSKTQNQSRNTNAAQQYRDRCERDSIRCTVSPTNKPTEHRQPTLNDTSILSS